MRVCPECGLSADGTFCPEDGSQLADGAGDPLLGQTLGQFRVARLLGVGGMGRVYKAVQPEIGSRVAVKVLSRECADSRDLVERFFAEARAVNLIRHENIVNVLDLATLPDGRPYIIMEYLDGAPLATIMERQGALPLGSLARLAGEVLDALGAAHAKSIIHRDLKPDNIFVTPAGRAKVLDFGIAKLRPEASGRSGPTRTGSLLGTPHYMAPEQAMAKPVDPRTDVYAMGVILYEGATGTRPFSADSLFELLRKQVDETPPPPRSHRPDLPAAFDALVVKAMAKDPAARHQSTHELAHALAEATQGLTAEAWAPLMSTGGAAARIGPPSVPTPSGGPTPIPGPTTDRDQLPYAATGVGTPVPMETPHGAATTENTRRGGRGPVLIGLGIAAVAIAAAVAIVVTQRGSDEAAAPAAAEAPATADAAPVVATADPPAAVPAAVPADLPAAMPRPADPTPDPPAAEPSPPAATPDPPTRKPAPPAATPEPPTQKPAPLKQPTPPATSPAPSRFSAFDVTGFIPAATKAARGIYDDAVLVRIDADGVYPTGKADLTLSDDFSVLYRFVSPSRAKRPDDLPIGVDHKPNCKIYVNVTAEGVNTYPLKGWTCDEPTIGPPKCSARQIWKKGMAAGAPSKNAVGELGYWADRSGRARWHLTVGKAFSNWIQDDC